MYVNIAGAVHLFHSTEYKAAVIVDSYTPSHVIWLSLINDELKFICAPCNAIAANQLVEQHNEIWNSSLAKALREEDV